MYKDLLDLSSSLLDWAGVQDASVELDGIDEQVVKIKLVLDENTAKELENEWDYDIGLEWG